jgi:hypothetical protein
MEVHMMKFLRKPYVSEFEQFMNGYLRDHPDVERDQLMGWRIWWERYVNPREVDQERHSNLKHQSYHSYNYE